MTIAPPERTFMLAAMEMARESRAAGDYAVGSVLVRHEQIVSKAGNRTHLETDPTHHAELVTIREAARTLATKDLTGCVLYSTHEPCVMCMGAVVWSRISRVVFGATLADHKRFSRRTWQRKVALAGHRPAGCTRCCKGTAACRVDRRVHARGVSRAVPLELAMRDGRGSGPG